jgi:hypothetical protein
VLDAAQFAVLVARGPAALGRDLGDESGIDEALEGVAFTEEKVIEER